MAKNQNNDVLTEKKVRTPRNSESILAGALKLPLNERAELVKQLKVSISLEIEIIEKEAEQAKAAINAL